MNGRGLRRITLVVAVCAIVGALAGIAGSAAAPSKKEAATSQKKALAKVRAQKKSLAKRAGLRLRFGFGPGPGGPMGGPVHSEAVVPNADGTGFDTVTSDNGTLNSVDGTTVHLKEGTDKKTYDDDVAIDVGSDAKVFRNHDAAKLSDLKAGDHVHVFQGPKGNLVVAEDDAFIAQEQKEHKRFFRGFRHHGFGPGAPPAPGPPPPGGPGTYPGDQQNG